MAFFKKTKNKKGFFGNSPKQKVRKKNKVWAKPKKPTVKNKYNTVYVVDETTVTGKIVKRGTFRDPEDAKNRISTLKYSYPNGRYKIRVEKRRKFF